MTPERFTQLAEAVGRYQEGWIYHREDGKVELPQYSKDQTMFAVNAITDELLAPTEGRLDALANLLELGYQAGDSFHQQAKDVLRLLRGEQANPMPPELDGTPADDHHDVGGSD